MVKSSPTEDGHLKVRAYATHAIQGGQSLWAEYRAAGSAGNLMWTREPLRFRPVYTDAALGLKVRPIRSDPMKITTATRYLSNSAAAKSL